MQDSKQKQNQQEKNTLRPVKSTSIILIIMVSKENDLEELPDKKNQTSDCNHV